MAVLGIDAAWTTSHSSGIAVVSRGESGWRLVRVAGSYAFFVEPVATLSGHGTEEIGQ